MSRRLVFMGSDPIAIPALQWIREQGREVAELVGVFTQPDRPHGRGQKLAPNAIKAWALECGLPVHQPPKLTVEGLPELCSLLADAALVMAYGHILRQAWLDALPRGVWNLHASLLPKLRGASPVQGAIASGERESGVCLMRVVRALDAGPVLDRERVALDALETGETLEAKLAASCVPLLARSLGEVFSPDPGVSEQDHDRATFTRRLRKEDGRLDFRVPAAVLARRINALYPWPGAFFSVGGGTIRVGLAAVDDSGPPGGEPGTVAARAGGALVVAAGDGGVRFLRLQRPGGRMLPADEFLRGHPIAAGTVIPSESMPELVASRPFKG